MFVLLTDAQGSVIDQEAGQPQLAGNGKSVTLAGDTDEQTVGGAQGLHVELAAGIFYAVGGQGVHLDLAVVGGGHDAHIHVVKEIDDGDGQGSTLGGVGTGTQLIEQYQAVGVGLLQDPHDVGHVGGEGTQVLLDALLIADVSIHFLEQSQLGALEGRDV